MPHNNTYSPRGFPTEVIVTTQRDVKAGRVPGFDGINLGFPLHYVLKKMVDYTLHTYLTVRKSKEILEKH